MHHSFIFISPFWIRQKHTARHTEFVEAEDEEGLVDLEAQDFGLDERERLAVDADEALALLAVGDSGGGLLLAEALD